MVILIGLEGFVFKPSFIGGNLVVSGNLTVQGSNSNINVTDFSTNANFIEVNVSSSGGPSASTAGIHVNRGAQAPAIIQWNESLTTFEAGISGSLSRFATQSDLNTSLDLIAPPGTISMYAGSAAPTGWMICDGSVVSSGSFSALATAIGSSYNTGGEGAGNFRIPNLKQRFPLGKSATGTGSTLGGAGGSIDHTHTLNSHSHGMTHNHTATHTHTMQNHIHSYHSHRHTSKGTLTANATNSAHYHRLPLRQMSQNGTGPSSIGGPTNVGLQNPGGFTDRVVINGCCQHATVNDASHSHSLTGDIGNTGTATNGDSPINLGTPSTNTTGSVNTTTMSTYAGSTDSASDTTGTSNPPYLTLLFIIKT